MASAMKSRYPSRVHKRPKVSPIEALKVDWKTAYLIRVKKQPSIPRVSAQISRTISDAALAKAIRDAKREVSVEESAEER